MPRLWNERTWWLPFVHLNLQLHVCFVEEIERQLVWNSEFKHCLYFQGWRKRCYDNIFNLWRFWLDPPRSFLIPHSKRGVPLRVPKIGFECATQASHSTLLAWLVFWEGRNSDLFTASAFQGHSIRIIRGTSERELRLPPPLSPINRIFTFVSTNLILLASL